MYAGTITGDGHLETKEMIAEGDTVAGRMTFTGTYEGDIHGDPPTGEEIEIKAMYRIKDGQLAEGWFVEGDADTLVQLGLCQELTE